MFPFLNNITLKWSGPPIPIAYILHTHASVRLHLPSRHHSFDLIRFHLLSQSLDAYYILKGSHEYLDHMPCHFIIIKIMIFDFLIILTKCQNAHFSIKMSSYAFLAKYCLTGCSGCSTNGESGPWSKDAALNLKMNPTMLKTDSGSFIFYILNFLI